MGLVLVMCLLGGGLYGMAIKDVADILSEKECRDTGNFKTTPMKSVVLDKPKLI